MADGWFDRAKSQFGRAGGSALSNIFENYGTVNSPTYQSMPESWNPGLRNLYAHIGDAGLGALSGATALVGGATGAIADVGDAVGLSEGSADRLGRDLAAMSLETPWAEFAVPATAAARVTTPRQVGTGVRMGADDFIRSESGEVPLGFGIGHNGAPRHSVNMPAGSDERYTGAATNRTQPYPRYNPAKVPPRMGRLDGILSDPNHPMHGDISTTLSKGQTLGGDSWYNTEELRDWFIDELGEEAGDAGWREYIDMVGATSTGSDVPTNMRNASFYYSLPPEIRGPVSERVAKGGITPREAALELGHEVSNPTKYRYGHVMQKNQGANVAGIDAGRWNPEIPEGLEGAALTKFLQANPKVKGFRNSLLGDETNIAADKHFMRYLAMQDGGADFLAGGAQLSNANRELLAKTYGAALEPYTKSRMVKGKPVTEVNLAAAVRDGVIKDTDAFSSMPTAWTDVPKATEYGALEAAAQRLAEENGMTPAQFQANLWMGAGDVTGLADESQGTFMELIRKRINYTAEQHGITPEEALKMFIRKEIPLASNSIGDTMGGAFEQTGFA